MVSGRHHSKAVKLAATVLARLAGEQAVSDTPSCFRTVGPRNLERIQLLSSYMAREQSA